MKGWYIKGGKDRVRYGLGSLSLQLPDLAHRSDVAKGHPAILADRGAPNDHGIVCLE